MTVFACPSRETGSSESMASRPSTKALKITLLASRSVPLVLKSSWRFTARPKSEAVRSSPT
eukprot:scaffold323_cov414-Prasinococcus_capsulatus_cf.AAC.37